MAADTPIVVKITVDSTQLDGAVAKVNDNLKTFSTTASSTAGALGLHSKSAAEAAAAMHGLSLGTTAAKRELAVLAHELSQGNFRRFGGSLLVLAEQTGAAGLLLNPVTLAFAAIAAVMGTFAKQAYEGEQQSEALANALRLTGAYAGVTEGQFNSLVKSVSASSGATLSASRDVAQAIVSTGQFGPRVLGAATEAAARYARATGMSSEDVAKDFAKMGDGVARYALEHDKSFNFLTTTQYAYIKSLEEQGKVEEAELVVLRALSDHFGGPLVTNLGTLEQTLNTVKGAWDRFWDAAKASGRWQTVDDQIAVIDEKLRKFNEGKGSAAKPGEGYTPTAGTAPPLSAGNAAALLAERDQLVMRSGHDALRAFDVASTARVHKLGVEAKAYLDVIDDEAKGATRLQKAMDELHRKQDSVREDGYVLTAGQVAAQEEVVRRRFTDTNGLAAAAKAAAEAKAVGEAKLAVQKSYAALSEHVAQESIAVEQRANDVLYQTGRIDLVAYYNTKADLERQSIDNQEKMLQTEYAATVVEALTLGKQADKLKNQAKQLDLVTKMVELEGKKALVAGREEAAAAAEAKAVGEAQLAVQKSYAALSEHVAQESIAVEQRANDVLYQTGRIDLVAYYNTKADLERQSIDNQEKMLQTEYAATVVEALTLGKQADKLKNQAKQLDLVTKMAELDGKKALVAGGEEAAAPIAYQAGRELRDSIARVNADLIKDDHVRAQAQLDIEIGLQREKLGQQLAGSTRYKEILDQFDAYTVLRQSKLVEDLKPEWQKMLEGFQDAVSYMRKASDDFNTGFINGGRDAFTAFVTTGKFSVGNLVQFIEQQFAKMAYDRFLAQSVSNLGSNIFGAVAGLFDAGAGGGALAGASAGGGGISFSSGAVAAFGGPKASGGQVDADTTYLVGEQGPELLRMGRQGGSIVPNGRIGGSVSLSYAPVIHIDSRTDQLQVAHLVQASLADSNRQMLQHLKDTGAIS